MPDLAIIIPHLNDYARLCRCLDRLAEQVDERVEVIVVDNGSAPDQRPQLWRYPWVTFLGQTIKGAGMARNLGVERSRAPLLAFLDSDCVPASDWVSRTRSALVKNAIVGGRVETFDEGGAANSGAQLFERLFAFDNKRYVTKLGFSVTANLVASRTIFDVVGPFKAEVSEDVEWCRRAARFGVGIVYDAEMLVCHPTRTDWAALRRKWRRMMSEAFVTTADTPVRRLVWVGRAGLTASSILRDGPRVLLSRRLNGIWERLKCLGVLCRLRLARALWMGQQALTGRA